MGPNNIVLHPNRYSFLFLSNSEFKEVHGHTIVPQLSGPLGDWVRQQRVNYKKFKGGRPSTMTAEKAIRLAEISFCFDASARFGKNKKD